MKKKTEDKDIHITFLTGVQKIFFIKKNVRKKSTLLCIIEEVKSLIASSVSYA